MDELIHYYSVDVAVTFDIDLDSDQIDTELTSDIYDTFVEELQEAFKNNSDVDLDDYDWSWDKEHDYIQHLYISSKLDKEAVTPVVENILDSIVSFERTDELWDGTYSIETHGLDTPPYEHIERTRDYTYTVEVECEVIRFFETTEDGEVLVEKVTKNELKDRAKKHAKKQRGITTLNPDAGNVEYNIGMFNKMSGAVEGPSNNPVSGPFGGDVSSGCCESLDDIEKNEKVFMEEYDFTNIDTTYTKEVGLNDYFESMNNEDDFSETEQEFSSAATSINGSKLPAIFKLVDFHANTLNLDYGGGKFDNATEYLKTLGVTNLIYDKFNRTPQHNQEVIRAVRENGGADTCTLSNVLNVIKEESIRHEILVNIHKLLKSDGILYITVFEGQPGQKEGPTKSGYQLARKTSEYIDEVANVFGEDNVTRRGKLIVARKQVTF